MLVPCSFHFMVSDYQKKKNKSFDLVFVPSVDWLKMCLEPSCEVTTFREWASTMDSIQGV